MRLGAGERNVQQLGVMNSCLPSAEDSLGPRSVAPGRQRLRWWSDWRIEEVQRRE